MTNPKNKEGLIIFQYSVLTFLVLFNVTSPSPHIFFIFHIFFSVYDNCPQFCCTKNEKCKKTDLFGWLSCLKLKKWERKKQNHTTSFMGPINRILSFGRLKKKKLLKSLNPNLLDPLNFVPFCMMKYLLFDINLINIHEWSLHMICIFVLFFFCSFLNKV